MSWCNCSVEIDEDAPVFLSEYIRRARMPHKCCECKSTIQSGEKYEHVAGKWGDNFWTYDTCLMCVSIRDHFCSDGFVYGRLDELLGAGIQRSLKDIRGFWLMDEKDKTIAGLIELVEELLAEIGYKDDTTRNFS